MKKVFFALLFVSVASMSFANTVTPTKTDGAELRTELLSLLGTPQLESSMEERVMIHFTVNTQNEVVILSTDNEELDSYIKSRLNYKQLTTSDVIINERYTLPLLVKRG
jgi:hypothetical protein